MKVAEYDHVEIARLLVEYEANLEDTNHRGRTALSAAAAPSMGLPTAVNTLRYLLQQGASQVAVDDRGRTPRDQTEAEKRSDAIAIFGEFLWVQHEGDCLRQALRRCRWQDVAQCASQVNLSVPVCVKSGYVRLSSWVSVCLLCLCLSV